MELAVDAGFLAALDLLARRWIDLLPLARWPELSAGAFYVSVAVAYGLIAAPIHARISARRGLDQASSSPASLALGAAVLAGFAGLCLLLAGLAVHVRRLSQSLLGSAWPLGLVGLCVLLPLWEWLEWAVRRRRVGLRAPSDRSAKPTADSGSASTHQADDPDEADESPREPPVPPEVLASWRDLADRAGQPTVRFGMMGPQEGLDVFAALVDEGDEATVLLSQRAVDQLGRRELTALVAHELAHGMERSPRRVWERWWPLGVMVSLVLGVALPPQAGPGGASSQAELWASHLAALPGVALRAWTILQLAVRPMILAYLRAIERRVNERAFELTGDPRSFGEAVAAMAGPGELRREPHVLIRWLCLDHPSARAQYRQALRAQANQAPASCAGGESGVGEASAKRRDA